MTLEAILKIKERVQMYYPILDEMLDGKLIEATRHPKENRKNFAPGQATREIEAAWAWYEEDNGISYVDKHRSIQFAPSILDTLAITGDTRDAQSIYSMITKPPQEWTPPTPKGDGKRTCKNTGRPIYHRYKNNKKIDGVKKKDLCPCSACIKLRKQRDWDISEYRTSLSKMKKKPKKDPMRYK